MTGAWGLQSSVSTCTATEHESQRVGGQDELPQGASSGPSNMDLKYSGKGLKGKNAQLETRQS